MLRSKATAALLRLKEMDRKYNINRNEGKRGQSNVSTESSLDNSPRSFRSGFKDPGIDKPDSVQMFTAADAEDEARSKTSSRSKIQVKIPSLRTKNDDVSSGRDRSKSKKSSEDSPKVNIRSSVSEDTDIPLKEESVSTAKESPRTLSNLESTSKRVTSNLKDKVEVETPESANLLRNNDESSVTTILSQPSEGSEVVAEVMESVDVASSSRRSSSKEKLQERTMEISGQESDIGYEATIDEVIKVSDERSEIISELTHATDKDGGQSKNSSREEQRVRYESDTFEEASSSTVSSSFTEEQLKKTSGEETVRNIIRSGVKQIMITPHKQTESVQKIVVDDSPQDTLSRDKEIIELVAPKIMENTSECDIALDEELSNYVRTTENVDEALPISLLKLSKQTTPTKKQARRSKRHRKSSNENTEEKTESPATSEHERLTGRKENRNEECVLSESSSSSIVKAVGDKNEKRTDEKVDSSPKEQSRIQNNDVEKKTSKNEVENAEPETIASEILLRETPRTSDVTCTLRKLNRDAIDAIARRHRIHTPRETSDKPGHCQKCGTIVTLPSAEYETPGKEEADDSGAGSLENLKDLGQDQKIKKRNKPKRSTKASKVRKPSNRGKVEEKHFRFDCRQSRRLRKQAVALRLRQEREDVRNYLLELECSRLEFGPGLSGASSKLAPFKPLEFPKIAAFVKSDPPDVNATSKHDVAGLQERISTIRQWLKDQYILYRDYSSLAQTVNAKYIPASLEDAKRTIRQLQRATIRTR